MKLSMDSSKLTKATRAFLIKSAVSFNYCWRSNSQFEFCIISGNDSAFHTTLGRKGRVCAKVRCATQELFNGPVVLQYDIAK